MKAIVDQDACCGCGLCIDDVPEVFRVDPTAVGDLAVGGEFADDLFARASAAADDCPCEAIEIVKE